MKVHIVIVYQMMMMILILMKIVLDVHAVDCDVSDDYDYMNDADDHYLIGYHLLSLIHMEIHIFVVVLTVDDGDDDDDHWM